MVLTKSPKFFNVHFMQDYPPVGAAIGTMVAVAVGVTDTEFEGMLGVVAELKSSGWVPSPKLNIQDGIILTVDAKKEKVTLQVKHYIILDGDDRSQGFFLSNPETGP